MLKDINEKCFLISVILLLCVFPVFLFTDMGLFMLCIFLDIVYSLRNIPLHYVSISCRDCFNKQTAWPIAEWSKIRWEIQTENDRKKKDGVWSHQEMQGEKKMNTTC